MFPTTGIGILIVVLIGVFFIGGFGNLLYQMFHRLRFEQKEFQKVRDNESDFKTQTTDVTIIQREFLNGVSEKCAIRHRIESLAAIKQRGGAVAQTALSSILEGRQSLIGSFPRHILSILVILGLIGTLVGLIEAVTRAEPMGNLTKLTDLGKVASTIGGTLGGMRTAFSTTLWGLGGTLALGFLSYFFNRKQSLFINELEDFTATALIPRFFPESTHTLQNVSNSIIQASSAINAASKKLTDVAWEVRLDESQQVTLSLEQSTKVLSDLYTRIEGTLRDSDRVANVIKDSQNEFSKVLNELLPDLANKSQGFTSTLKTYETDQERRFAKLLGELATTITNQTSTLYTDLSKLLGTINEELTITRAAHENDSFAVSQMVDEFNHLVSEYLNLNLFSEQVMLLREVSTSLTQLQQIPQAIQQIFGNPNREDPANSSFIAQFQLAITKLEKVSTQLPGEGFWQKLESTLNQLNSNVAFMNINIREKDKSLWKRIFGSY